MPEYNSNAERRYRIATWDLKPILSLGGGSEWFCPGRSVRTLRAWRRVSRLFFAGDIRFFMFGASDLSFCFEIWSSLSLSCCVSRDVLFGSRSRWSRSDRLTIAWSTVCKHFLLSNWVTRFSAECLMLCLSYMRTPRSLSTRLIWILNTYIYNNFEVVNLFFCQQHANWTSRFPH